MGERDSVAAGAGFHAPFRTAPAAFAQRLQHLRQGVVERRLERVRGVDDEHAAGAQTRAIHGGAHVQRRVQPAAPGLLREGLEPARQAVRLGPGDDGIPDGIDAGGEALQPILHRVSHFGVVALDFVAGVDQHQRPARSGATGGRWQQALERLEAVMPRHCDLAAGLQLVDVRKQRLRVGRVQLKQFQAVVHAGAFALRHQRVHQHGRAGVHAPGAARRRAGVETRDQRQVIGQRGCYVTRSYWRNRGKRKSRFLPRIGVAQRALQAGYAGGRLAGSLRRAIVQPIDASARMRVDQQQRRVLAHEVTQDRHQGDVLEHVGVVAGMEGVAITEHAPW